MAKRKLLIITYYWPPAGGAGVQRWLKFVKYLSAMGFEPHIYTPENPEAPAIDNSLLDDIPANAIIIKRLIWEPFGIFKKLTNKKGNFNTGFLSEGKVNRKKWSEKLALFIRANVFIPDAKMFWIKPSVRFLKKYIEEEKIELVISTGPPHSLHLIALKLKRKINIKWIADFRDPWTNIDFKKKLPTLNFVNRLLHRLENTVLLEADNIIVVGSEMKREFEAIAPQATINIITNGFDSEIAKGSILDKRFSILHIGSINADRNHETFYKAISELIEEESQLKDFLRIQFIGKVDYEVKESISTYKLEAYSNLESYIPYSQVSLLLKSAQLLYLPINNTPNAKGILTGKFFEYLAANRPIIAQGPIDGDIAKILNETKAGKIFEINETSLLKDELRKHFYLFLSGKIEFQSQNIKQYSRENLTKKLVSIINKL